MPGGVHGAVEDGGGKEGSCSSPRPAVKNACDGGQHNVAPVGEAEIRDVGEAEEHGGGPPASDFTFGRARKSILQQAAKEKLFGPRGEEENAQGGEREGHPLAPARLELNEVHAGAQRDGNNGKREEAREDEEAPVAAPANRVAYAVHLPKEYEHREGHVHTKKHGHHVRKLAAGKRPEPMRHGEAPAVRERFYGHPDSHDDEKVLPNARRFSFGGRRDGQRNKCQQRGGYSTTYTKSICPQGINQVDKKHSSAEQMTRGSAEARGEDGCRASRGKQQHDEKQDGEGSQGGSKSMAAITVRSEERRVGKECRSRWVTEREK